MKISDFDIYHLPPLMGMFVDYLENDKEDIREYPANTIRLNVKQTFEKSDEYNKPALNYAF